MILSEQQKKLVEQIEAASANVPDSTRLDDLVRSLNPHFQGFSLSDGLDEWQRLSELPPQERGLIAKTLNSAARAGISTVEELTKTEGSRIASARLIGQGGQPGVSLEILKVLRNRSGKNSSGR